MEDHAKIEREISKRSKRIEQLKVQRDDVDRQIRDEQIGLDAIMGVKKLIKPVSKASKSKSHELRANSDLERVRQILLTKDTPLHIKEIVRLLGKEDEKKAILSLAGSMSGYAKENRIFSKPGPNIFGLREKKYVISGGNAAANG